MTGPTEQPMPTLTAEDRSRNAAMWVLRICVAGMCIGYSTAMFIPGGATLGEDFLRVYADDWLGPEADFLIIYFLKYLLLIIAVGVLICPHWLATGTLTAILVTLFVGEAWTTLRWARPPYETYDISAMLKPASSASRYIAPAVLAVLWTGIREKRSVGHVAIWLLRFAAAATFAAHGFKACMGDPSMTRLIVETFHGLYFWSTPYPMEELILKIIGVVDIIVAGLVLVAPWRPVVAWMAFWGFLAAGSRMTAYGWDAWYETAIRLPNGGVPLALLILWWYRTGDDGERGSIDPPLNGETD